MNWVAISFTVYTVAIMAFGLYSARFAKKTSEDFFLADRGLGAWVAALSSSASAESGWVTIGLVGFAYKTGIAAFWVVPGTVIAFLINWLVLANRMRAMSMEHGAVTVPDLLAARHSGGVARAIRIVAIIIILTMLTAYVAAQLNAAGKAFGETFGWKYAVGVLVGAGIVLIYTLFGGFRAVAWTDVIQAALMIAAVILLPIVMIIKIGGPGVLWTKLQAIGSHSEVLGGKTGAALIGFLSVWIGVPWGNHGQPHILVRFMATKDESAVRRASIISSIWVFFLFTGAILVGVAGRVLYDLGDGENALPRAAVDLLPAPIAGIVIAAVIAAMCSTADSQLLVSASAVSHDGYARLMKKEKKQALLNRLAVLGVALAATIFALTEVRVVFDFVLYAWDALGAAFGPAIILTLLWRRTTGAGVLAGMIVGVTTAVVWRETLQSHFYALIPAFILAFAAVVLVSLVDRGRSGA